MLLPPRLHVAACLILAVVCGWLFYTRYWAWRDCIREAASSCITPDGANLTSGGMLWGLFAGVFAAFALRVWMIGWDRAPRPPRPPI